MVSRSNHKDWAGEQSLVESPAGVRAGYRYVVDIDLSKFFDRVCHDRLLSRLATRVKDPRVFLVIPWTSTA